MSGDETARLLETAAKHRALADEHEAKAVALADCSDASTVLLAAAHFTVAAGLRGQARFRQ